MLLFFIGLRYFAYRAVNVCSSELYNTLTQHSYNTKVKVILLLKRIVSGNVEYRIV
jgi:hypothetical protein